MPGIACFDSVTMSFCFEFRQAKEKNSVSDILKQLEINESLLNRSLNSIKNTQSKRRFSHLFIIKKKQEVTKLYQGITLIAGSKI